MTTDHADVQTIVYSVPGQEAVRPLVSYARQDATVAVKVDLKALGREAGCKVLDAETNEALPLAGLAQVLRERARGTDLVVRYGGDDFVVLLPATTKAEAARVAETLRAAVS